MLGLEPGDEARRARLVDFAETQERAHLVDVAADVFGQPLQSPDERIGMVLHQPGFAAQACEQRVEEGKALGVVGEQRVARQVDERTRDGEARSRRRLVRDCFAGEQVGGDVADLPDHVPGRYPGGGERARGVAPGVEIVRGGEGDDLHATRSSC